MTSTTGRVGTRSGFVAVLGVALTGSVLALAGTPKDKPKAGQNPATGGSSASTVEASKSAFIDEMLQKAWDEAKIKPSPAASEAEFLRRAYLDVLGRIPNVQEASSFLDAKEPFPKRRQKLIEGLL